jgi:hypothetical protein
MERAFILLIVFVFTIVTNANNLVFNDITIPKEYKTESTFSGDLSDTDSFHLIFTKNNKTKTYKVFSYLFDGRTTIELPSLLNVKPYNVLSFHYKNNILSLLVTYNIKKKKSFLKRIDYNLLDNSFKESEDLPHKDLFKVMRVKDRSILIYQKNEVLTIKEFIGNNSVIINKLVIDKFSSFRNYFKDNYIASVRNDEFVKNGSTNVYKLYYNNLSLNFTKDTDLFRNTEIIRLDLSKDSLFIENKSFDNDLNGKFQKMASFFHNDKLYQFIQTKEKCYINIFDVVNESKHNTINLDENLNDYVKNNPKFQGITNFLKHSKKGQYITTITANSAKNNKIRIRLDYVDINYSYNYNFWFHQQMMRQMQQDLMRPKLPSGFGPNDIDDYAFNNATVSKSKRFFELLIDDKGNLLKDKLPETVYKEIDKKKEIDHLKDVSHFKFQSSCFLKNSFRYIAFDRVSKGFIIHSYQL